MKKYIMLVITLIIVVPGSYIYLTKPRLEEIKFTLKKKIGDKVTFVGARTIYEEEIAAGLDSKDFFIQFFTDEITSISCLDIMCGKEAKSIVENNGHLIALSDRKPAKVVYGLSTVPIKHKGRVFEHTLLVIISKSGRILKMYKNAKMRDIPNIIKNLKRAKII